MKIYALLATLVLSVGSNAFAQAPAPVKDPLATPRIDAREANQEKRIQQGLASGRLTEKEASRLNKGEMRIEKAEDRAKEDGVVSGKERAHLKKMENRENREIRQQKHDSQRDMNHDGSRDGRPAGQHNGGDRGGNHGSKGK